MAPTPPNPNVQTGPTPRLEYSDTEKGLLDISKVEAWRAHQHGILNGLRDADPDFMNGGYLTSFNDNIEDSLDEYLAQQGLDSTSVGYGRIWEMYRKASIDKVRDEQWYTSPSARGEDPTDTVSGRDKVIAQFGTEMGVGSSGPDLQANNPETDSTPEALRKLRDAKYEAYVNKLRGSAFGRRRDRLQEEYERAEATYLAGLLDHNKAVLEAKRTELLAAGKTDSEVLAELQKELKLMSENQAKEDRDAQHKLLVERGGWVGRWMERYANLTGNQKFWYGAGLGALALGSGVAIGFGAGLVGGAIGLGLATGVGGGLARGLGALRTYQLRKSELFKKDEDLPELNVMGGDMAQLLREQEAYMKGLSRNTLDKGEKIKRKAVYWTLGTVAVGGALGTVSHIALDGGSLDHWWGGYMQHVNDGSNGPRVADYVDHNYDKVPPKVPGSGHGDVIRQYIEKHAAARDIRSGEGWYQTFKELGVKSEDYHKLLQDVGDDLHKQGLAYWDKAHSEWRMHMTPNHKMPNGALRTILEHAQEKGYLKTPLNLTDAVGHGGGAPAAHFDASADHFTRINSAANIDASADHFTRTADIIRFQPKSFADAIDQLNRSHVIDVDKGHYPEAMNKLGAILKDYRYADNSPIVRPSGRYGRLWEFVRPSGVVTLPERAVEAIREHFTLAA